MRLLLFVSVFGILISIAILIVVLIKSKKDDAPAPRRGSRDDE